MGIKENIIKLRELSGLTQEQFADVAGVSRAAVSLWEIGKSEPRMGVIERLADHYGIKMRNLIEPDGMDSVGITPTGKIGLIKSKPDERRGDDEITGLVHIRPVDTVRVPIVGRIAAGTPREAFAQSDEWHDTPTTLVSGRDECFWLVVAGNSMNRLFPEGALVLVDMGKDVRNGDVGVVFVNGYDATMKRVYYSDDAITLHPESYDPEYRDIVIRRGDPEAPEFRPVGRVVSYTAPDNWRA